MYAMKKQKRSTRQSHDLNSGFTLVELLLVIAIISVLSVMSLGVLRSAQDNARSAATQSRITQIESLLAIELEDFEVRRLPISNRELAAFVRANPAQNADGDSIKVFAQLRALRRQILMDLINSEFPRPCLDVTDAAGLGHPFRLSVDVGAFPSDIGPVTATDGVLGEELCENGGNGFRTWLEENYAVGIGPDQDIFLWDRLNEVRTSVVRSLAALNQPGDPVEARFDLPGEYLFAVLQRIDVDGTPAVELITNAAIGNVDGDAYPELIDAWGEPLQLRIWQIDSTPNPELGMYADGSAVFNEDVENLDFDLLDVGGVPTGYTGLDPRISREIQKIRFQVVSTRLARDQGATGVAFADPR